MSADLLRQLLALDLSTGQALAVMDIIENRDGDRKEKARARWHKWNDKRLPNVSKREPTLANVSKPTHASASPAPDLENKQTNKQENKIDASPSAQPKRGTRVPDDFEPDQIWAQSQGLSSSEALFEAEQFIDFWRSKPGKDGLKLDWPATWRTWVRNAIKRQTPRRSQGPPNRRRNYADVAMDRMNGNGPKGIFSTDGDAQRLSSGQRESGPDDGNLRSGLSRRFLASDH